ncbi:Rha family transcriptional regulator [uncultured Robinsoniella sp.]|uniref:Rha family transcriptional regulator n=1 Tax=uncultured Robinsoniella sp. TaxID=904190 RepID=UPI00205C7B59|nr:MAG TPA: regulatory protein [Caudoviricetes sp.]
MKELEQMITTVDIAEMMDMQHKDVLKKLNGRTNRNGVHTKGIIEILNERQMSPVDYFIKSSYMDAKGEERPCYKLTRKGCEFLANKFQGEKGIIFTAKYIERFHQMEDIIKQDLQPEPQHQEVLSMEFSGKYIERKTEAAGFIMDFIDKNNTDVGVYRAYISWCLERGNTFLTRQFFQGVKSKVMSFRLENMNKLMSL